MAEPSTATCPACGTATVRVPHGQPWCPACEWNLQVYDPALVPPRGWYGLEKLGHRWASRLDHRLHARLSVENPQRPGWTRAHICLVADSATIFCLLLATFLTGLWLIVMHASIWTTVLGTLLILLALLLRPRLYRAPHKRERLAPGQAPTLVALVEHVADRIGARPPDYIVLDNSFNASVERSSFRQRTTMRIGMLLWVTLPAQDQVALLAHELRHTVNGDPNRGLLIRPAMNTFRDLAIWTGGEHTLGYILDPDRVARNVWRCLVEFALWPVSRVFLLIHLGLSAIGLRDHQTAEYLADHLAAQVAGAAATVDLLDRLSFADATLTNLAYAVETHEPATWRQLAATQVTVGPARIRIRRQRTRRATSLWDSHPPSGLRAAIVEQRTAYEPGLVLPDTASAQIDRELRSRYEKLHHRILGTRDFRGDRQPTR